MPSTAQKSVTTAAAVVIAATRDRGVGDGRTFLIRTSASTVYVGPAGVTASTGYLLVAGVEYPLSVADDETYYGITSSGTATLFVWGPE